MSSTEQQMIQSLKSAGYSVTTPRKLVFAALSQAESLTMAELTRHLRGQTDRASIYRSIELFEKLGIVQRLQVGWKYRLELSDQFNPHHHHIHCSRCGRVVSLSEDDTLENNIRELSERAGFTLESHQLELTGHCKACT